MGIPSLQLPDKPPPPVFTEAEFEAMPLTAKGKILRFKVENDGHDEIARTGFRLWREWAESLFKKQK